MSVFRELSIEWQGKTYHVTPSNRLLRRIEGEGISLAHMITRIGQGEPPISEVSFVAAELLKSGGATVTEDEIYGEIMASMAAGGEAFVAFATVIVEAISPKGMTGGKPVAPLAQPQPATGAKRSRK